MYMYMYTYLKCRLLQQCECILSRYVHIATKTFLWQRDPTTLCICSLDVSTVYDSLSLCRSSASPCYSSSFNPTPFYSSTKRIHIPKHIISNSVLIDGESKGAGSKGGWRVRRMKNAGRARRALIG